MPHILTLSTSSPFWWGQKTGFKSYRSIVFEDLPRTGIPRSSGITRMLANGGKLDFVMKIAGHSNPQTTLNHYVRSENFDLQDTVNLLSN
jgi:integrase